MNKFRLTCILCASLLYLLISKVEEFWLMIMENVPQNEKLTLFLDHYVQQLLENQNVPIETWNIYKHRSWTNHAVEGWNFKLNSVIRKQQQNIFLQVQKLKEKAEFVSRRLK